MKLKQFRIPLIFFCLFFIGFFTATVVLSYPSFQNQFLLEKYGVNSLSELSNVIGSKVQNNNVVASQGSTLIISTVFMLILPLTKFWKGSKTSHKTILFILIIAVIAAVPSGMQVSRVQAATPTYTIDPSGLLPRDWSYLIYQVGSTSYAINGTYCTVDYSGTDASTVIQAAIDTGETIFFVKAEDYSITTAIALLSNQTIVGEGIETRFLVTGAISCFTANGKDGIIIKDLFIVQEKLGSYHPAVWFTSCTNSIVLRVTVDDANYVGFDFEYCTNCNVEDSRVIDSSVHGGILRGSTNCKFVHVRVESCGDTGLEIADCIGSKIEDCWVQQATTDCYALQGGKNCEVARNYATGFGRYGITVGNEGLGGAFVDAYGNLVAENQIVGTVDPDSTATFGINFNPTAGYQFRNMKIAVNIITYTRYGINCPSLSTGEELLDFDICDNTIWAVRENLIQLIGKSGGPYITRVSIQCNHLIGQAVHPESFYGIRLDYGVDCSVKNNILDDIGKYWVNNGYGISLTADDTLVEGNSLFGCSSLKYAMYIDGSNNQIKTNYFDAFKGINIMSGTANIIKCNDFVVTSTPISDSGTSTVIKYNEGYITENSGTQTIANGETVLHGLTTTPTTVVVTARVAVYGTPAVAIVVAASARGTTTFTVSAYWVNGTAITADAIVIDYYAEYKP